MRNIHRTHGRLSRRAPTAWATHAVRADGSASPAVPAGRYRLRAWHHRGGEQTRELQVSADGGAEVTVALDARTYRFVQHRNKFGKPYPPDGTDRY
ncbi:MAG: hypothetical protein U5K74_11575 [Gemmatimonadaceae bacterium]|nr:hypothetical protein [Gemmatimonadaceae bacterium]